MKIEIDIPELDESNWEYLGVGHASKGQHVWIHDKGIWEWEADEPSYAAYPTFRRRKSWKDQIVWPRMLAKGYIGRDKDGDVYWQPEKITRKRHFFWTPNHGVFDLSFLPKEFWECDWKDSLVEVKHDN